MATTPEGIIPDLLAARLAALVLSPTLPIAWPNVDFTPPSPPSYLEVTFLPNGSTDRYFDDGVERIGLFQVSVVSPLKIGVVKANETAGLVAAHFPRGLRLVSGSVVVRISGSPSIAAPIVSTDRLSVPVTVAWRQTS